MRKQPKVFEAKNSRAVSLLKSWLRALGISFKVGTTAGVDLVVTAKDDRRVSVHVNAGDAVVAPEGAVVIEGSALTGRNIRGAISVFGAFVESLGYEARVPVSRGELPETKLDYNDHFEEVSWRHTELRRCPNPTNAELLKYERIMKQVTWNFFRTNPRLCSDNMLDFTDLFTFAMVWTVIYLGYYEVPEHQVNENNNEKKLYTYLMQRFLEFKSISEKKGRNIFATLDVANIGTKGEAYDYEHQSSWWTAREEEEEIDEAYISRHNQLDLRTPNTRRASAAALLDQHLKALPHNEMVTLLKETAENVRLHPDAQSEALRRLGEHRQGCTTCVYLDEETLQVREHEEGAGVDAGGALE